MSEQYYILAEHEAIHVYLTALLGVESDLSAQPLMSKSHCSFDTPGALKTSLRTPICTSR